MEGRERGGKGGKRGGEKKNGVFREGAQLVKFLSYSSARAPPPLAVFSLFSLLLPFWSILAVLPLREEEKKKKGRKKEGEKEKGKGKKKKELPKAEEARRAKKTGERRRARGATLPNQQ